VNIMRRQHNRPAVRASRRGRRLRRAYILIVILGFTAVITSLGMAFLEAHSTVMPEAVNRYGACRARYLAESGVYIANHFLMYPPTGITPPAYWTGANNIAVDATSDYTNVATVRDATNLRLYTVTAVGVALNPDGTVRGKRTITEKVIVPEPPKVHIPYACLVKSVWWIGMGYGSYIPSTVAMKGDLHGEGGWLWSQGSCDADVSATDRIYWSGSGAPTSFTEYAPSVTIPTTSTSIYSTYKISTGTYAAYSYGSDSMTGAQATALNNLDWSTTNPGRIIIRNGNLRLRDSAQLNGTLVVTGELRFEGANIKVTAVKDYPALVVAGHIGFESNDSVATITGPVLCAGEIRDRNKARVKLTVNGAVLTIGGFDLSAFDGQFKLTYDEARAQYYDFAASANDLLPITILSWQES